MGGNKVNWIVMTDKLIPPYQGGPVILHHMTKKFLDMGDRVIVNNPYHSKCETLTVEFLENENLENFVCLVTENDFRLDRFKPNNVVRFLLYKPNIKGYNKNELIIQYGKSFTVNSVYESSLSIKPIIVDLNFWKDLKYDRSKELLILNKKGKITNKNYGSHKGFILDDITKSTDSFENIDLKLLDLFNKHEKFITYDNETFHSIQAALCGAISIVIPDGRLTEEEWRSVNVNRKYGIAYGDTEDQIEYAKRTVHKLRESLEKEVNRGDRDIEILREIVLNKFY